MLVWSQIKGLYFSQVSIRELFEDISRFDGELHGPSMMSAQNLQNLIQADTIAINNSIIFELMNK